jgi:hypothetical protein
MKDTSINLGKVELCSNVWGSMGFVSLNSGGDDGPSDTLNNSISSTVAPLTLSPARHGRGKE